MDMNNSTVFITFLVVMIVFYVGYMFFSLRGFWKMFDCAGFPGWLSLVPILNIAIMFKMAKMSSKWLLACLLIFPIPIIFIVWIFKICKAFEKDSTYILLTILFGAITIPLIGYGEKKYDFGTK